MGRGVSVYHKDPLSQHVVVHSKRNSISEPVLYLGKNEACGEHSIALQQSTAACRFLSCERGAVAVSSLSWPSERRYSRPAGRRELIKNNSAEIQHTLRCNGSDVWRRRARAGLPRCTSRVECTNSSAVNRHMLQLIRSEHLLCLAERLGKWCGLKRPMVLAGCRLAGDFDNQRHIGLCSRVSTRPNKGCSDRRTNNLSQHPSVLPKIERLPQRPSRASLVPIRTVTDYGGSSARLLSHGRAS